MAQFEKRFVQDLTQDIKIQQGGTIVFNNDNLSNVVGVALYNGKVPASVSGTVVGAVIAPDGATVPVGNGTISGNTVSITLTRACFALPGNIGVGIQVVTGDVATTVLKVIYNVELFSTDTIVDPDSRITLSLAEIQAKLDEIPTILANAQTAIDGIEAQKDTMIASIASVAGQGTDTTLTQSGVAADAKATGDQVRDLKSAFDFNVDTVHNGDGESTYFVRGFRSTSNPSVVSSSTTRCTSGLLFHLYPNDTITISNIKSGNKAVLGTSTGFDSGWKTSDYTYKARAEMYVYINEATSSGSGTITPSDITTTVTVVDGSSAVKKLENTVDGYTENLSFAYTSGSAIEKSIYYSAPVGSDVELSISGYSGTVGFLIYYTDNTNEQYDTSAGRISVRNKKKTIRFVVYKSSADASGNAIFTLSVHGMAHDIVRLNNKLVSLTDLLTIVNQSILYADGSTGNTGRADRSTYIAVNRGETAHYKLAGLGTLNALIAFYDKQFSYVQADSVVSTGDGAIAEGTWTANDDGYILLMNKHYTHGYFYFDKSVPDIINEAITSGSISVLPNYYNTYLESKLQTIRQNTALIGDAGDEFVWITDYHIENNANNSPALLRELTNKTSINRVVFGGDAYNSADTKDGAYDLLCSFTNLIRREKLPEFDFVIGNHEYNDTSGDTPSKRLTINEAFAFANKGKENEYTIADGLNAYFRDNAKQKIRYFYLACDYVAWVRDDQIAWIAEQFETVPSGWSVFVFTHRGLNGAMDALGSGFNEVGKAMDALKIKGTYTYNGTSYDYSGTNVTVIGSICGHTHIDGSYTSAQGIPHICTTTDAYALQQGSLERLLNTTSEQAFDVVQIDKTNRKIYCTRIGAGVDREFSF